MPKKHFSKSKRRYKRRGGGEGEDYDIEQGPVIPIVPLKRIPTDPLKRQEEIRRNFTSSISPAEAEKEFNRGPPSLRERNERSEMSRYDRDRDVDAYTSSEMPLFSEGGRTKKHRRKSRKTRRVRRKTKRYHRK